MKENILSIKNLSYSIDGKTILKDLSFEVKRGDSLSIIGPNGAGKSTLLKIIVGINTGWNGSINLMDKDISSFSNREIASKISFVPQGGEGFSECSVEQFMEMSRYPYLTAFSRMGKEDIDAVEKALSITEMLPFIKRDMGTLSGGERQRVFIAAALCQGGDIMLLDEPSTFLDPVHRDSINRVIRKINVEEGVTTISVTHDINDAVLWSDSVAGLRDGKMVFKGSSSEVMNEGTLEKIFGRKFLFAKHPQTKTDIVVPEVK